MLLDRLCWECPEPAQVAMINTKTAVFSLMCDSVWKRHCPYLEPEVSVAVAGRM